MADITAELLTFSVCNSTKPHQPKEQLKPYPVPDSPWSTVVTYMFEWHGQNYLVLVDSYSGWYEIDLLREITSSAVIKKLKRHFSVHGTPHTLIYDNARQYCFHERHGQPFLLILVYWSQPLDMPSKSPHSSVIRE